jgi:hypothetical protein
MSLVISRGFLLMLSICETDLQMPPEEDLSSANFSFGRLVYCGAHAVEVGIVPVIDVAEEVPIEEGREQIRNTNGNTIATVSHDLRRASKQSNRLTTAI